MAKTAIIQYDPTTPANNTDIGGVGIQGSDLPRNLDNAIRTFASQTGAAVVPRRSAKSAGYTAVQTDFGQTLDFTAAATLATDAAATLLDGWFCQVYASGGDVTINPNSAETVNGETSIVLKEGWSGILRVNDGNFIFQYLSLRDDTPTVAFLATSSKNPASGSVTAMDDIDAISEGTLGNSTLSNGVFTVGAGDAGWYQVSIQYKPVDTGSDYTRVGAFVLPSAGIAGNNTVRMASGLPVWVQCTWSGELAEAATLTLSIFQVNGAAAARSADTGTYVSVRRVGGIPA